MTMGLRKKKKEEKVKTFVDGEEVAEVSQEERGQEKEAAVDDGVLAQFYLHFQITMLQDGKVVVKQVN